MTDTPFDPNFPENREYWEAVANDRLLVKRCGDCGKPHYYPRAHCPFCASSNTAWEESQGNGRIYSYTIVHHASPPYCPAYVTLDEGPTMLSLIVESDVNALKIDAPVRLVFRAGADGRKLPMFTLET